MVTVIRDIHTKITGNQILRKTENRITKKNKADDKVEPIESTVKEKSNPKIYGLTMPIAIMEKIKSS